MPDICRDIDFNVTGQELQEECGVTSRKYMAYRNIPEHRNLLQPKGATLVQKGNEVELRLQSTLPISLPGEMNGKILFDEKLRRNLIKSKMDYCEFFPENANQRIRIISLRIPLDMGGEKTYCFTVLSSPTTAQRKAGYASKLESLDCADFQNVKKISEKSDTGIDSVKSVPGKAE